MGLIAFDLDDTLFPERDFLRSSWRHIATHLSSKYGLPYDRMLSLMSNADNAFDALDTYLHDSCPTPVIEDVGWMVETYRSHIPDISLTESTATLLRTLTADGHTLALITDGRSVTQRNKIATLGLDRFVEDRNIFVSEEISGDKISGEAFRILNDRYRCGDNYYIGDNPAKDFYWPNKLGWTSIMLRDSGDNIHNQSLPDDIAYHPQHTIDNLSQLNEILK